MEKVFYQEFVIAADLELIPGIIQSINGLLESAGFAKKEALELEISIEEALTNIVLHSKPEKDVEIRLVVRSDRNRAEVTIEDGGQPFDPLAHQPANRPVPLGCGSPSQVSLSELELQIGGHGIQLIKAFVDDISYERGLNKNILKFVKINNS
jgi:anti-sigma regulatory factor (Ser/Thr protein kinase)